MDVRMYSAFCSLCAGCVVAALGCADQAGAISQRQDPFASLTSEELFVQQPHTATPKPDDATALVSASTPLPSPALVSLRPGESLATVIDRAKGPVLLDFFADWCGPCRTQSKILHNVEETAAESGTLMVKINIDQHPDLAEQLNVSSLPTLMLVKDGKVIQRRSGLTEGRLLTSWMR